jgi:LDH2 family malate/lactate/ureidoglycolate dehydrogenase
MPAPYEKHRAQLKAILLAWGMPKDNAEATADILSWADLHGVDSHGLSMIPGYDRLRRAGRANMAARPRIIKETPVSALVDGDGGLGHVPARFAMQVAIDKAKQSGMAIAAVRNSAHFGATGYYTLMAAKEGLIGMACTSAVQHPGGADLRQGGEARHRSLVLRGTHDRRPAVSARHGNHDGGRRPHPQQGQ